LYKEAFSIDTWKFLKPKLKDVKGWDIADSIGQGIVGEILLRHQDLEKEILKISKSKNQWLKKMAISSAYPSVRKRDLRFPLKIAEVYVRDKNVQIQKAVGELLNEISKFRPGIARQFINKNRVSGIAFVHSTESLRKNKKGSFFR
jgi:3-methyladenine DNA glycosylase AlkD